MAERGCLRRMHCIVLALLVVGILPETVAAAEHRVLLPGEVPALLEKPSFLGESSAGELLAGARLRPRDAAAALRLHESPDVSIVALPLDPLDAGAGDGFLLFVLSVRDQQYPILVQPGEGELRLQLLGTNDAVAVRDDGTGRPRSEAIEPFAPGVGGRQLRSDAFTGVRTSGWRETLSCVVSVVFSRFTWSDILCASADYGACVLASGGAGVAGCLVAFKALLPDCADELQGISTCFGVATDSTKPAVTISQPASGATVSGSAAIVAGATDNALQSISVQVDYQVSSTRKLAVLADSQSVGGCSLSATSATCSTSFNFGQATPGTTANVVVVARDTAGNVTRQQRSVTTSSGITTYKVSGNAGTPGAGVTGCAQSTVADASGNYSLTCTGGTWTVIPSKSGCTFTPSSRSVTVGPNASGVSFTASCGGAIALLNGQMAGSMSGGAGTWAKYRITVPSGQTQLRIGLAGGSGDADLYVKYGTVPTAASYDYRPYLPGNNETVVVNSPAAGDWYIGVFAYSAYAGASLLPQYGGTCASASLTGTGNYYDFPMFTSSTAGRFSGLLRGPSSSNFNLVLWKWTGSWAVVAQSANALSHENVSYSGTAATYLWRVNSVSGSGGFTLCTTRP